MTSLPPLLVHRAFTLLSSHSHCKVSASNTVFFFMDRSISNKFSLIYISLALVLSPKSDSPLSTHALTSLSLINDALFIPRESAEEVEEKALGRMPWLEKYELYFMNTDQVRICDDVIIVVHFDLIKICFETIIMSVFPGTAYIK